MRRISFREKFADLPPAFLQKKIQERRMKLQQEENDASLEKLQEFMESQREWLQEYYEEGEGSNDMLDFDWELSEKDVETINSNNYDNELGALIQKAVEGGISKKAIAKQLKEIWYEPRSDNTSVRSGYFIPKYALYNNSEEEFYSQLDGIEEFENFKKHRTPEEIEKAADSAGLTYSSGGVYYYDPLIFSAIMPPGSSYFEEFKEWVEENIK